MLARVGLQDNAVSPWFVRRMARMLTEVGVNVTLDLVAGKEHWWWDTDAPNDGGVNNDPRMRAAFTSMRERRTGRTEGRHKAALLPFNQFNQSSGGPGSDTSLRLVLQNPATFHGRACLLPIQLKIPFNKAQLVLSSTSISTATGNQRCLMVETVNLRRLRVLSGWRRVLEQSGSELFTIDRTTFSRETTSLSWQISKLLNTKSSKKSTN